MCKFKLCAVITVLLQLHCVAVYAQTSSLSIRLFNQSDELITGGTITLSADSRRYPATEKTPGTYQIDSIRAGVYTLEAAAFRYQSKTASIKIDEGANTVLLHLSVGYNTLENVVVTGYSSNSKIRASNLSMHIVGETELRKNMGGSLVQTLSKIPGIEMMGIGAAQAKPTIRGLGFDRMLVIDKGIKHEAQQWGADHGLEIDQFSVNEVEIIKGPASFLYGAGAIGGVLKINPALKPQKNSFGGSLQLIGKTSNMLGGLAGNLYTRNDKWFFTTGFSYQDYADYKVPADSIFVYDYAVKLHNRNLRNTAGVQSGLNASAGFVGEKWQNTLYVSNVFSRSGLFANAHGLEPKKVNHLLYDKSSRDIMEPSDQVNHFKVINYTAIATRQHAISLAVGYQNNFRQEFSKYVAHGYMPATYPSNNGIPQNLEREYSKQVFSFQLNDEFKAFTHNLTMGASGEIQLNKVDGWSFLTPAFKQYTAGIFVYDKITINSKLSLHLAARTDFSYININAYRDWFYSRLPNGTQEQLERASALKRNFSSLTGSAGITYNLRQWWFKVNVGKSFRVPIAKELAANGVNYHYFSFEKGNPNLDAEESWQLDASASFKNENWYLEISPFINYFPNYIYLNPTARHDYFYGAGNQIFQYSQSKVFRAGGEMEANYRFSRSLSTGISGEYLYAQQLSGDKAGYGLPSSPPHSATFSFTFEPQQMKHFSAPYISADAQFVAPQNRIVPPEKQSAGYMLMNLQAGSQFHVGKQTFDLNTQIRNLFNTSYLMHTSFYRLIGLPEEGINFILSFKTNFNISKSKKHND